MTEIVTAEAKALAATGATAADLDAGQSDKGAPKAPASGASTGPTLTAEQVAAAKVVSDKAEADKAALALAEAAELEETHGTPEEKKAKADAKAEADAQSWQDQYMTFDDPAASAVVELLKTGNVSPVEANAFFAEAIKLGDATKIDWVGIEKKIGPAQTVLAKAGVEQYWNGALAVQRAIVTDTYAQLGGEANWTTLKTWTNAAEKLDTTGAFKAKVDGYRKMIDLGGEPRRMAVAELKTLYDADPKTKGFGTEKLVTGEALAAPAGEPLSRAAYVQALHDAQKNKLPAHLVAGLHARRKAGITARI